MGEPPVFDVHSGAPVPASNAVTEPNVRSVTKIVPLAPGKDASTTATAATTQSATIRMCVPPRCLPYERVLTQSMHRAWTAGETLVYSGRLGANTREIDGPGYWAGPLRRRGSRSRDRRALPQGPHDARAGTAAPGTCGAPRTAWRGGDS